MEKNFQSLENFWSKIFDTPKQLWSSIYYMKITKMHNKQIAEFNYKLLHNILNNNLCVRTCKWNLIVRKSCETVERLKMFKFLLYDCNDSSFVKQKKLY